MGGAPARRAVTLAGDGDVLDTVAEHLASFNARDAERTAAGFAQDAVFAAGDQLAVGRRAIHALFADAFAAPVGATIELRQAYVAGDTVACELVEHLELGGDVQEFPVAAFYTVRSGLLVRVRVYRDAQA
jgi:hypothetical protein